MPEVTFSPLQHWIMESTADEVFCGSERGASKSYAVSFMLMWRIAHLKDYRAVLFRRRFTELRDTVIPELRLIARIIGEHRFHFTEGTDPRITCKATGSEIALSAAEKESDAARYQGANKNCMAFDEPQNIPENILKLVSAIVRSPEGGYRPQFYYMANPLGVGHTWLKKRFVVPARGIAQDGNVHWGQETWNHPLTGEAIALKDHWKFEVETVVDGEKIVRTREVMLAGTKMNPVLNYRRYHAQMRETLSDTYWEAWGENNWDVMAGQFYPELERWLTNTTSVSDYDLIIGSIDPGYRKTACVWLAIDREGHYRVVDDAGFMDRSHDHIAPELLARHPDWNDRTIWIMDPAGDANTTSGRSTRQLYGDYGLHAVTRTARGSRSHGWNLVRAYGNDGRLKILNTCSYTIGSLERLIFDIKKNKSGGIAEISDCEKDHGSEDQLDGDHWADALRYALEFAQLQGYDEPTLEQLRLQRAWNNPLMRPWLEKAQRR